jgi:hypothetical protein
LSSVEDEGDEPGAGIVKAGEAGLEFKAGEAGLPLMAGAEGRKLENDTVAVHDEVRLGPRHD